MLRTIVCPQCNITGQYSVESNFDTYLCECNCIFYKKNDSYIIGKNPLGFNTMKCKQYGKIYAHPKYPNCPLCHIEITELIKCDNDCGTVICNNCNCSFFADNNNKITIGHFPLCGVDEKYFKNEL